MMSVRFRPTGVALPLLLLTTASGRAQSDPSLRAIDSSRIDSTCSPCQDFFRYANGRWLDRTTIPPQYSIYGLGREVQDRNEALLRRILEGAAREARTTSDPNTRRVGLFYGSCMDSTRAEREGVAPLQESLARIGRIRTRQDLATALGRLARDGVNAGLPVLSYPDFAQSDTMRLHFYQGGIGLPDREYYLSADSVFAAARRDYRAHMTRMLLLLGLDSADAPAARDQAWAVEMVLARAALPAEEATKLFKLHHPATRPQLDTLGPRMDWSRYFDGLGVPGISQVNVAVPQQLRALDSLSGSVPIGEWRAYLQWRLASAAAPWLDSRFAREALELRRITRGETSLKPRWQRCLDAADDMIGEALGEAYVREAFSPKAKARVLEMIAGITAVMRDRIRNLSWMAPATKQAALAKLEALGAKIGYPDRWRDYSKLDIREGSFFANVLAARRFESDRTLGRANQPVDRTEWYMTPPTYNAYHSSANVEIVFPAGILQPPLFDPAADDAVNYGATGATIGHEILHAFDDNGRHVDARGNLREWWTPEDSAAFERRADLIVEQYEGYLAVDTLRVNGRLTLGENLADIGGLMIAYEAWRRTLEGKPTPPPIDGYTAEQRFFLAYANSWREKVRPESERNWAVSNPHAPVRWRVNGVVGHLPAFGEAFGCAPGAPMVVPPERRMQIW